MRKILSVFAVSAVLLITGCSNSDSSTPVEQPSPTPTVNRTEVFLQVLHDNTDYFDSAPDSSVIGLAHSVCGAWSRGAELEDIGKIMIDNGIPADEAGFFIGDATAAFCPQYNDDVSNA